MSLRSLVSTRSLVGTLRVAALAAVAILTVVHDARAQSLIDFLWGGEQEWGGKRQVIQFDAQYTPNQIIVSFGDRRLYLITKRGEAVSYPIAVPREQDHWQGRTTVSEKKINPSWRPTPDMLRENPKLPSWVPGGHPMNPLGVRAMYLGASMYRIHGTDAPWTIGQAVSKGCIRMYNEDVLDLYPRVPVGMRVTVTWQTFTTDGMHDQSADASSSSSRSAPTPYSDDAPQLANTSAGSERRVIKALAPLPRREGDSESSLPDDFVAIDADGNAVPKKFGKPKPKAETASVADPAIEPKIEPKAEKKKKDAAKTAEPASKSAESKTEAKASEAKPIEPVKAPETGSLPDVAHSAAGHDAAKAAETAKAAAEAAKADASKSSAEPAAHHAEPDPAVEAAKKAAEAAAKAAKVAREAADAAKKAAEDAKKATSEPANGKESETTPVKPAKSAAL